MAASSTIPQLRASDKPAITKSGVLTLNGFGIKVKMRVGHLEIEDGVGPDRRNLRLPRVGHGLKRLVIISSNGFITLEALRWLADQECAFAMLDRDGKVLTITGPVHSSDARLRRAQALALANGTALKISRELIATKLDGQATVMAQDFRSPAVAEVIAKFREQVTTANTFERIRLIESQAARSFWHAWSDLPVRYPREELIRIPEHWKTFGQRVSVLTGSPRLATNPPNAVLNFCYSLVEAESRLALAALGLDPGIGFLHTDTPGRDSLACDLMETVRPKVDAWLVNWLQGEHFSRSWFFETREGNCRLAASFAAKLAHTSATWRKFVAPWAEYIARELWTTTKKRAADLTTPATRLTQQKKREVKGSSYVVSARHTPPPERICVDCGGLVNPGHYRCKSCASSLSTKALTEGAKAGRILAQSTKARRSRIATKRRHDAARQAWERSGKKSISEATYTTFIQPKLKELTLSAIMEGLQVSVVYASHIRRGKRVPHPRHWQTLVKLIGS